MVALLSWMGGRSRYIVLTMQKGIPTCHHTQTTVSVSCRAMIWKLDFTRDPLFEGGDWSFNAVRVIQHYATKLRCPTFFHEHLGVLSSHGHAVGQRSAQIKSSAISLFKEATAQWSTFMKTWENYEKSMRKRFFAVNRIAFCTIEISNKWIHETKSQRKALGSKHFRHSATFRDSNTPRCPSTWDASQHGRQLLQLIQGRLTNWRGPAGVVGWQDLTQGQTKRDRWTVQQKKQKGKLWKAEKNKATLYVLYICSIFPIYKQPRTIQQQKQRQSPCQTYKTQKDFLWKLSVNLLQLEAWSLLMQLVDLTSAANFGHGNPMWDMMWKVVKACEKRNMVWFRWFHLHSCGPQETLESSIWSKLPCDYTDWKQEGASLRQQLARSSFGCTSGGNMKLWRLRCRLHFGKHVREMEQVDTGCRMPGRNCQRLPIANEVVTLTRRMFALSNFVSKCFRRTSDGHGFKS